MGANSRQINTAEFEKANKFKSKHPGAGLALTFMHILSPADSERFFFSSYEVKDFTCFPCIATVISKIDVFPDQCLRC